MREVPELRRELHIRQHVRESEMELVQAERRKCCAASKPDELRHAGSEYAKGLFYRKHLLRSFAAGGRYNPSIRPISRVAPMQRLAHATPIYRTAEVRQIQSI